MIGIADATGYAVQLILLLSLFTYIVLPSFLISVLNKLSKLKQINKFKKNLLLFIVYISFAILSQFIAIQLILIDKIYAIGWLIILSLGIYLLNLLNIKSP